MQYFFKRCATLSSSADVGRCRRLECKWASIARVTYRARTSHPFLATTRQLDLQSRIRIPRSNPTYTLKLPAVFYYVTQWHCNLGHRPFTFQSLWIFIRLAINNGHKENSFRVHARDIMSHKQIISSFLLLSLNYVIATRIYTFPIPPRLVARAVSQKRSNPGR